MNKLALLLVLILVGCTNIPEGEYDVYPASGQVVTPGSMEYCNGDTCWTARLHAGTTSTPTPLPTLPTLVPTLNASPTGAPTSTLPTPEPSPTPESGTPITPQPSYKECSVQVAATSLRERTLPSLSASINEVLPTGTRLRLLDFTTAEGYVWGKTEYGWVAIYRVSNTEWFVNAIPGTDLCQDVPSWPPGLSMPIAIAQEAPLRGGFHVLVGGGGAVLNYVSYVGTVKAVDANPSGATASIALQAKQQNPKLTIVYRSIVNANGQWDGPLDWEWTSPGAYWAKLKPFLPGGFDYYEFINEWDRVDWKVYADFSIAVLSAMGADGYCGLFGSFAPGNPSEFAWGELVRVLRWIDTHPCGRRYHGLALHQSGLMPPEVQTLPGSYLRNEYVTRRHEKVAEWLAALGYDLASFRGPIYITELGWQDYTVPNQAFDCAQVAAATQLTLRAYEGSLIDGIHIWNYGGQGQWVDLSGCLGLQFAR